MSLLVKWNVGTYNASTVIGVTAEEAQWGALMGYLTSNGILYVASGVTPTQVGLYCYPQADGTYCIFQAVATPDWNPDLGPAPIYTTQVAYLDWIWVPA
jgi:hypothetical protein